MRQIGTGGVHARKGLVVFVEGDTERVFYSRLIRHLIQTNPDREPVSVRLIQNVNGIGGFASKAAAKFENEIVRRYPRCSFGVAGCYDADVFELSPKPPVNWPRVRKELRASGAHRVIGVRADQSVEDWFLLDLPGICRFLGLPPDTSLSGKTGLERMKNLFRRVNRVYIKGSSASDLIAGLDLGLICTALGTHLTSLQNCCSVS